MTSPESFYLHIQGEQRGPYTIPQLDHLLHSGLIAEETLYWREGLDQWQPVTSLIRLRRKRNPWRKRLWQLGIALLIAAVLHFFGSIALIGWKETNQHEYTPRAAYWRARGVVRGTAVPAGALVQFKNFFAAQVDMVAPDAATVTLHGEIAPQAGESNPTTWLVPMKFSQEEWTGGPARVLAP